MRLAHATLGRTAIAATMRAGRLVVTVGESQSFNGSITGTIALAKTETGADFKTQMQFADIDLEKVMTEVFRIRRVEGAGNVSLELESTGRNVQELARNLNGSARISAKDGALTGMNVEQLLRRLALRPLSGSGEFRNGRTPFDRLNIELQIVQGTATIDDVHLEGPNVRLGLTGTTSIPAREFDLAGTATLTSTTAEASNPFELPFVVQGPWDDPVMLPDAQTLIRRSGAGAPLLDAVRDRKTLNGTANPPSARLTAAGRARSRRALIAPLARTPRTCLTVRRMLSWSLAPSLAPPLPTSDAATTATATTAIRMVQIALISGFTPSRTSRIDADRQRRRAGAGGEARDHEVVERQRERQQKSRDHRRHDQRQGDGEEGAAGRTAEVHRGFLQAAVEAGEPRLHDHGDEAHGQRGVRDDDGEKPRSRSRATNSSSSDSPVITSGITSGA